MADVLTPKRTAFGVSVLLFVLYLLTLSPTFGFVDKGELAAVGSTLGIAHPTGYPTIMLLGKLFTLLLPMRDVVALNVMSALLTAIGGGFLVLLFDYLLRMGSAPEGERGEKKKGKGKNDAKVSVRESAAGGESMPTEAGMLSSGTRSALAGLAALLTGLTATWWDQGTGFEVYSLHCLLLPLVTLLFLKYVEQEALREGETISWDQEGAIGVEAGRKIGFTRRGIWFALMLGLAFTNHLTTILLAPPMLVWYFWRLGLNRRSLQRLLYLAPPFLLGLLPYIWLPIRASMAPVFNWGNPESLWAFTRHLTGAQYRVWMFTNRDTFPQQTHYFLSNLSVETIYVGLALALLGVFFLAWRRWGLMAVMSGGIVACLLYVLYASGGNADNPVPKTEEHQLTGLIFGYLFLVIVLVCAVIYTAGRSASMRSRIGLFTALAFIACIFYTGGYDIMEIAPYYLTAFFAVGIWMLFGLAWLTERINATVAIALGGVIVLVSGVVNYRMADESENTLVEDATVNILAPLPEGTLIFSKQWDFWLAGSFYMQGVENMRRDVTVIDYELLRRSWYLDQLQANHPELMAPLKKETEALRAQLYKFERDLPYNPNEIEGAYVGLINAMVDKNMGHRPVFATPDFDENRTPQKVPLYGGRWGRVPYHLTYELVADTAYVPVKFPEYRFRFAGGEMNAYTLTLYWLYVKSCLDRAQYEQAYGRDSLAQRYREYAKTFDPKIAPDDIPALPLNSRIAAVEYAGFFARLRGMDPATGTERR